MYRVCRSIWVVMIRLVVTLSKVKNTLLVLNTLREVFIFSVRLLLIISKRTSSNTVRLYLNWVVQTRTLLYFSDKVVSVFSQSFFSFPLPSNHSVWEINLFCCQRRIHIWLKQRKKYAGCRSVIILNGIGTRTHVCVNSLALTAAACSSKDVQHAY